MSYSQVLRLRAFRNLWLGQSISQIGDSFFYAAFMFIVQRLTGSYAMVGFVGACETAPYLLLSLYGGVVADRLDRRTIMLTSDLLSGTILCTLAGMVWFFGKPPIWAMLVTPFLLSSVRSFFMPAKNAAIPAIVPEDSLMQATALSSITSNLMPILGLSLSAGVLGLLYSKSQSMFLIGAVLVNSLSFFGSAVFIALLPKIKPKRSVDDQPHPWTDLKNGLRYIRDRHALVVLLVLQTGLSLAISPFYVIYVAANNAWLGGRPQTLALCELFFFVGMVGGSVLVGKLKIRHPGKGFIFGTIGVGLPVLAMAFSPNFFLFFLWNFVAGVSLPFSSIPVTAWIQASVPDAFQGRVNSVLSMLQMGVQPVGLAMGGFLVSQLGIAPSFIIMGGGMALAAAFGLLDKEFRRLEMPV